MKSDKFIKNFLLNALLIIALAPFIILSFYNFPAADDLILTHVAKTIGLWENIKTVYMNWSGRYFSTFIMSVNPLVYDFKTGYLLLPVLLIMLLFAAIYHAIKPVLSKNKIISKHTFSLLLLMITIELLRSPVEAFYWLSGALNYTLPLSMLLFLIILLLRQTKSVYILPLVCILSLMIAGSNEIILLLSLEILLIIFLYKLYKKEVELKLILAAAAMVAGGIILLLSPGNSRRMEFFPLHGNIIDSLVNSVFSAVRIAVYVLKEPAIIVFILVTLVMSIRKLLHIQGLQLKKKSVILVACISVLIIISLYFPGYYAMGIAPPPRIHNTAIIVFVFLLFVNIMFAGNFLSRSYSLKLNKTPDSLIKILLLITVIFLISTFEKNPDEAIKPTGNIMKSWNDLLFIAKPYKEEMSERTEKINAAKQYHNDSLILKPVLNRPATLFYMDITENPNHWINISFREYYHLKYVKLQK